MGHSNETDIAQESRKRNRVLKPSVSMREVAQGQEMTEKRKGRQPEVFIGTSALFSLTTVPRADWVKGNHRCGYHDRLGRNQKDL